MATVVRNLLGVIVNIQWKGRQSGHAFSWIIENGVVRFLDFKENFDDAFIRNKFWKQIDPNGSLTFAELKDSMEIDFNELSKYANFK